MEKCSSENINLILRAFGNSKGPYLWALGQAAHFQPPRLAQGLGGLCPDAGCFDRRTFWVVHDILHASVAIRYNRRQAGKKKLATLFFSEQYQPPFP